MAKTGIPGVIISFTPKWTKGAKAVRGYIFKKYNFPDSVFQRKQQLKLSEAATAQYGSKGFINGIPAVASKITSQISGGVGAPSKEDRRRAAHADASNTIARLRRIIGEQERMIAV